MPTMSCAFLSNWPRRIRATRPRARMPRTHFHALWMTSPIVHVVSRLLAANNRDGNVNRRCAGTWPPSVKRCMPKE